MKNLIQTLGTILFWITWPALFVYFKIGRRTRLFVICDREILVVRSWYGDGNYIYPGGGLHRREDPTEGALRELYEETGLSLSSSQLTLLFEDTVSAPQKISYKCVAFGVRLDKKPPNVRPRGEIAEVSWKPIAQIKGNSGAGPLLERALEAWEKQGESVKI